MEDPSEEKIITDNSILCAKEDCDPFPFLWSILNDRPMSLNDLLANIAIIFCMTSFSFHNVFNFQVRGHRLGAGHRSDCTLHPGGELADGHVKLWRRRQRHPAVGRATSGHQSGLFRTSPSFRRIHVYARKQAFRSRRTPTHWKGKIGLDWFICVGSHITVKCAFSEAVFIL